MNRVVYDSVDAAPQRLYGDNLNDTNGLTEVEESKEPSPQGESLIDGSQAIAPKRRESGEVETQNPKTAQGDKNEPDGEVNNESECDNDHILTPYYQPNFKNDKTLVFESRFESGNMRRAI